MPNADFHTTLIVEIDAPQGGILFHPPGDYQWTEGEELKNLPYRQIAKDVCEKMFAGSVMAIPQERDQMGNPLWAFQKDGIGGDNDGAHRQRVADFLEKEFAGTGIRVVVLPVGARASMIEPIRPAKTAPAGDLPNPIPRPTIETVAT